MAEVLAFVTDRRREDLTLDFKVVAGNFAHFSAEPVAGSRTPGTRGRSKEALGSITIGMSLNRQVPPSEERCHNVAKTGVDSGGLQETGGDDRMAGT